MNADTPHILLAFIEGLGLAASPCILPVLPFILAASVAEGRLRPFFIITGFVASFSAFALLSRQLFTWLPIPPDSLQRGSYLLLLILGAVMVIPQFDHFFAAVTQRLAARAQKAETAIKKKGYAGAFLTGGLIGLVWTPCAGPLMAAALLQTLQAKTTDSAVYTIIAFSLGAGLPMLAVAAFGQYLTHHLRLLANRAALIRRAMGVVIICFALAGLAGINIGLVPAGNDAGTPVEAAGGVAPYAAPDIAGITQWFNTEPLSMAALKGKVVLIDFWTYSCINCIRTIPHIEEWYEKYKNDGFVVVGIHTPEFAFETVKNNVEKAVGKFGITYPVAMDNGFTTWNNYQNRYWPAHYLIDRDGRVVYTHFGEGNYATTENTIRQLLGIAGDVGAERPASIAAAALTPETYLGNARAERLFEQGQDSLPLNGWTRTGDWDTRDEYIESRSSGDSVTLHFAARKVFLVMESTDGKQRHATITIDGQKPEQDTGDVKDGVVTVSESQLYRLVDRGRFSLGKVTITAGEPGLRLYAFTFEQ